MKADTNTSDHAPDIDSDGAASGGLSSDIVERIECTIVDIPIKRLHKLSSLATAEQNYVIVRIETREGVVGIGEASTLGGPRWSEETAESIAAVIDRYIAPAIVGKPVDGINAISAIMDKTAKRNNAAKSAIECALFDIISQHLGVPMHRLFGGAMRDRIRVAWTLASGDPGQEIEEAKEKLEARRHNLFKIKMGALDLATDSARITKLAGALGAHADLIVDANEGWDEPAAHRLLDQFDDLGIALVEQPLGAWDIEGAVRLKSRSRVPIMVDEGVFSPHDALAVARAGAADVVSLKLVKHGGPTGARKIAAIAEAGGLSLYGGCLLESSIGAAAHLHFFASLEKLQWHCEHFGPQILVDEIVTHPIVYDDFCAVVPDGPGAGVEIDPDKLRHYRRKD